MSTLCDDHNRLRQEATALAGRPGDLIQRAAVYHHLYRHSRGNHAFTLLAAHGALWARGYLRTGLLAGRLLALQFFANPTKRRAKYQMLEDFAEAFREINRRVCVETYATYHLTAIHGEKAAPLVSSDLLPHLLRCHDARQRGVPLSMEEKRALFRAFFVWEQENVVGPSVDAAVAALDWPVAKWIAMRPSIRFRYFGFAQHLLFSDFSSKSERVEKGLAAFDIADRAGWRTVEDALKRYRIIPKAFFENPLAFCCSLKSRLV